MISASVVEKSGSSVAVPLQFLPVRPEDCKRITGIISGGSDLVCQYSAGALFALAEKYGTEVAFAGDCLLVAHPHYPVDGYDTYLLPKAQEPLSEKCLAVYIEMLRDHAAASGRKLMIWGAGADDIAVLERLGFRFRTENDRNLWDYVYRLSDLAELPNPLYRKRRTAVKKFMKDFDGRFQFALIQPEVLPQLRAYEERWLEERFAVSGVDRDLVQEQAQILKILDNFTALDACGAYVMVDGAVAAFTLAVPLTGDTFDMTTLKISRQFGNVAPFLVSEFAKVLSARAAFINLEEDLGLPGLRKFKTDFHPFKMIEKNKLFFTE